MCAMNSSVFAPRSGPAATSRFPFASTSALAHDGSSDRTAEIVEQAQRERPGVRLVRHDVNRGYGAALRTGFEAGRSLLPSSTTITS